VIWLGVACAGATGATTRFVIERVARHRFGDEFPWAPWGINSVGSLALGVVVGLAVVHGLSLDAAAVIGTGFIGSFTVVGPLTFDSLRLGLEGRRVAALMNSVGALVVCTSAAALGLAITGAI
jgi:CrcB protein